MAKAVEFEMLRRGGTTTVYIEDELLLAVRRLLDLREKAKTAQLERLRAAIR